jgi:hypothetical protein
MIATLAIFAVSPSEPLRLASTVHEVDPLTCSRCGQSMKVLIIITDSPQVLKILHRLAKIAKPPPGLDTLSLN